jgi:class 3 adenylate cyclase
MAGLLIHLIVFLAVNAFLTVVWAFTSGSFDELAKIAGDPSSAWSTYRFWPAWSIVSWATALVMHAGIWLVVRLTRRGRRRRHRAALRRAVPTPPLPSTSGRQRVTVVFTDIVGSTDLAESLGDDEWESVLGSHRRTVRELLAGNAGREVGTQGDGFLVRFDRPADAVGFAVAVQRRLDHDRVRGDFAPQVRIGVHMGEATDNEGDLVGRVLNLASRVTSAAEPGEILVTEPVADHLPTAGGLDDRGLVPLRGVAQPRHLLAVRWRDEVVATEDGARW